MSKLTNENNWEGGREGKREWGREEKKGRQGGRGRKRGKVLSILSSQVVPEKFQLDVAEVGSSLELKKNNKNNTSKALSVPTYNCTCISLPHTRTVSTLWLQVLNMLPVDLAKTQIRIGHTCTVQTAATRCLQPINWFVTLFPRHSLLLECSSKRKKHSLL